MKWCSVLLMLLVLCACEKKGQDAPVDLPKDPPVDSTRKSPFLFIPRSDVKWLIHYQGSMIGTRAGYVWDTTYHFFVTVTPTGSDTLVSGYSYSMYHARIDQHNHGGLANQYYRRIYLREDTAAQTVIILSEVSGGVIDFVPKDTVNVQPFWRWPKGNIVKADSLTIDGVKYPRWNFKSGVHEFFYQSSGIGGVAGLLGAPRGNYLISGNGGIPRSLDYIYKNDSLHFEFPLY